MRLTLWLVIALLLPKAALALTVQAPAGGAAFSLPEKLTLCAALGGGWSLEPSGALRPPATAKPGEEATVRMARAGTTCGESPENLRLVVTAPPPRIDRSSVVLAATAGQLEFQGSGLQGLRVQWQVGSERKSDTCLNLIEKGNAQSCSLPVGTTHKADPATTRFEWTPEGGRFGKDVLTFDAQGALLTPGETELVPQRVLIWRLMQLERSVDVSRGSGQIAVLYPEAVAEVRCDGAQCELVGEHIVVRSVPSGTARITVNVKLAPRILISRGDKLVDSFTREFEVVRCDLVLSSGAPLRDVDEVRILARLPANCGVDAERLTWTVNTREAVVERVLVIESNVYVLLRAGRILDDKASVVAARPQDQSVLAFNNSPTVTPPPIHTALLLEGFGEIDFIPKNQSAVVATSTIGGGSFVPIEVPGAYSVTKQAGGYAVRGVYMSSGYTALRLAYRVEGVPAPFADTHFATLTDPIQRPIREANVPVSFGATTLGGLPVFEIRCALSDDAGKTTVRRVPPGRVQHVPFSERDSCRLLIHHRRIPPDSGEQLVDLEVSVTTAGEVERGEARLSERLLLRHGPETDVIWIRGAKQQFDRIHVRVHHVVEEANYLLRRGSPRRLPVGQWTLVTEDATLKFYATASIPSGLYRFSDDEQELGNGALALNFGVLARLTLLSEDGKESLVGLEGGMMTMGLATERDRQLALVGGLGVGVPLGNVNQPTQASLNIHAWLAYSLGDRSAERPDTGERVELNPWGFVFGPSITIGSLAAFL